MTNASSDVAVSPLLTCPVCTLTYPVIKGEDRCPNQWREYTAPYRKAAMLEFTQKRHAAARANVVAHREAMERIKASTSA